MDWADEIWNFEFSKDDIYMIAQFKIAIVLKKLEFFLFCVQPNTRRYDSSLFLSTSINLHAL